MSAEGKFIKIPIIELEEGERAETCWRAVCNKHIAGWLGPIRKGHLKARQDAINHNAEKHGGDLWAGAIRWTCPKD